MSKRSNTVSFLLVAICMAACSSAPRETSLDQTRVLMFGASGRIGGHIAAEALSRGYPVTGVSRDPQSLEGRYAGMTVVEGDILNPDRLLELVRGHDVILVSVGGPPTDDDPANYIAATAAKALIDALAPLGDEGPRMIFVGNVFTLKFEDNKTPLELGRVPETHRNIAMFRGHQIALDQFRASRSVSWTVASPPNGLRLKGRTGEIRWGDDEVLRDPDGTPSTISLEDFAYAVLEELEAGRYVRKRFTAAK